MRTKLAHRIALLALVGAFIGCGLSAPDTAPMPRGPRGTAGGVRIHPQARLAPARSATLPPGMEWAAVTNEPQPVAHPMPHPVVHVDWNRRLISPFAIDRPHAPAWVPEGGVLRTDEHFEIVGVPPGVAFRRVAVRPAIWEAIGPDGKRLALVQSEVWTEVMNPYAAPDRHAPLYAESAGKVVHVERWGGGPADLSMEQLVTPLRLFRIERRADGTDWLVTGFIYEPPGDAVD